MSRDVGVSELLALLQSSDLKELEQVKSTISEQLNTGYSSVLVCLAVLLAVFFAKTVLPFILLLCRSVMAASLEAIPLFLFLLFLKDNFCIFQPGAYFPCILGPGTNPILFLVLVQ